MDPIGDMLIMIKNGNKAGKESVSVPHSRIKFAVASALMKAGFVASVDKKVKKGRPAIEIVLKYDESGKPKVNEVKRVSKPSRRMYKGVKDLHPIRQGYGTTILSTPKGVLSDKDARKEHVGGEIILTVW